MKRAWPQVVILCCFLTLALPGVALAHVTISPEEAAAGATQVFTVYVPTEKDVPTTGVSLEAPEGFEVVDAQSPPGGWRGSVEDGSVTWSGGEIGTGGAEITSPEGQEIQMGESQEFTFEARAPRKPGNYAWATTQTYKDGSTVEWSGTASSERPTPTVRVAAASPETTAAESGGHEHGAGEGDHEHDAGEQEEPAASESGPTSPYLMAGAGAMVALTMVAGLVFLRGRGRS